MKSLAERISDSSPEWNAWKKEEGKKKTTNQTNTKLPLAIERIVLGEKNNLQVWMNAVGKAQKLQ